MSVKSVVLWWGRRPLQQTVVSKTYLNSKKLAFKVIIVLDDGLGHQQDHDHNNPSWMSVQKHHHLTPAASQTRTHLSIQVLSNSLHLLQSLRCKWGDLSWCWCTQWLQSFRTRFTENRNLKKTTSLLLGHQHTSLLTLYTNWQVVRLLNAST
jgi:hypothetical protein